MQRSSTSQHVSRRRSSVVMPALTGAAHAIGHLATNVGNTYFAMAYHHGDAHRHVSHHATVFELCVRQVRAAVASWHGLAWHNSEKLKRPIIGSLSWVNLVFGESIAIALQGVAQSKGLPDSASFGVSLLTALTVELAFTYPIAARNIGQIPDRKRISRAMATAFWLGGAMGVENERLPRQYMLAPVGAYMVFGILLALAAEYDNLAQKLVESEYLLVLLVIAGIIKKVNGMFEYKGVFERLSEKTVDIVERVFPTKPKKS